MGVPKLLVNGSQYRLLESLLAQVARQELPMAREIELEEPHQGCDGNATDIYYLCQFHEYHARKLQVVTKVVRHELVQSSRRRERPSHPVPMLSTPCYQLMS